MTKFDLSSITSSIQKQFKDKPTMASKISLGSSLSNSEDVVQVEGWLQEVLGIPGIPFGKVVQISGDTDTGKTTTALSVMRSAQAQGVICLYVETEGKTTKQDLVDGGVDPVNVILIQSSIAEEAFELLFKSWDAVKDKYPEAKLLVVIDSFGNIVSKRDSEMDLVEDNSKPGGKGKINRIAINKMIAKRDEDQVAFLLINYNYDNIGSVGKTNAGGKALYLFSAFIVQTTRKSFVEKTVKGVKMRAGVNVVWKITKDHLSRTKVRPKEFELRITGDGVEIIS